MDPLELRRKNFIPADAFPHETAIGVVYDSGDYHGRAGQAARALRPRRVPRRAGASCAARACYRGIGFSTYTEICGLAPSRVTGPVGLRPAGRPVGVGDGARAHHRRGDRLHRHLAARPGPRDDVRADRRRPARHRPADRSRSSTATPAPARRAWAPTARARLAVGGESIARATDKVADKARAIVAHQLEAAPEDIELARRQVRRQGLARQGHDARPRSPAPPTSRENLPGGHGAGAGGDAFYDPENFVFPFGAHACVVDVDAETGKVDVVRYVAVDDCGPAINPMLIDGQVHGGIVHAIGQALYERIHYDEDGQLVTGTFVDYALPSAAERAVASRLDRTETPSPVNSLGVKGVGEAGTIAASPGGHQRRHRRAAPARRDVHQHAARRRMRVWEAIQEADRHDPRRVRLRRARVARRGARGAAPTAARTPSCSPAGTRCIPLMKLRLAAPSLLVDLRQVAGPARHRARERRRWRIGALTPHADVAGRGDLGLVAAAAATIADQQVRNRGTIGGSLAHGDPASDLPAVLLACEGSVTVARRRRRARGRGRRPVPGLPDDRASATARSSPRSALPGARRLRATATRSSTAARRTGRWSACRALVKKAGDGIVRGRAHRAHPHGLDAAAGDRGRGGAARAAAGRRRDRRARPSRPPRAPSRPATSTPRPTTSATWRGCCTGGR